MLTQVTVVDLLSLVFPLCLILAGLIVLRRYRSLAHEVRLLKNAMRSVVRKQKLPEGLNLTHDSTKSLWHTLSSLTAKSRSDEDQHYTFSEVLNASDRITNASDETSQIAREVVKVLVEKAQPELLAAAVILRNSSSNELELVQVIGIPERRVTQALLTLFDTLLEEKAGLTANNTWGYQLPQAGSIFDFRSLGVGVTLTAPLRNAYGNCGGIWLGFKHGATSLTPQRRVFVEAVARHAASSFLAAEKVRAKTAKSDQEKAMLLSVSHDLRAPGNAALYAIRDLISGEIGSLTPQQITRLNIIERALQEQLELLTDVLDFTKHQRGFIEARPERVRLSSFLSQLVESFTPEATARGLSLELIPFVSCETLIDRNHLRRILTNFLSNAIKYTEQGSVRLFVTPLGGRIEIAVVDSGIGVPENERESLFLEFHRLTNGAGRQGIGLGLALSKALSLLNNSEIFYRPGPDGGSIFGVVVPLATRSEVLADTPRAITRTILVVDDDPAACRANIRCLREFADCLIPAGSCAEAASLIAELSPDLLVTDLYLNGISCEGFLDRLKTEGNTIPTVVITGSADSTELEQLRTRFKVEIVQKPYQRAELQAAVLRTLEKNDKHQYNPGLVNGAIAVHG